MTVECKRKTWVAYDGSMYICDTDGHFHSFGGKPSKICPDGSMYWYDNGMLMKIRWPSGHTNIY